MTEQTEHESGEANERGKLRGWVPRKWRLSDDSRPGWLFLVGGAIFPLLVVALELTTRICAMDFIDPMPTYWHSLLVGLVPFANFWTWLALGRHIGFRPRTIGMVNGYAMGVSFLYTLWFLPMLPLALIAIIVWGLGLLPMAPLFSFIAALWGYFYLRRLVGEKRFWRVPGTVWGLAIVFVVAVVIEAPILTTRIGMNLACSHNPEVRLKAIQALRILGNEKMMLHWCYRRWNGVYDPLNLFRALSPSITTEKAREVFYRVTGTPFDAVPPPATVQRWDQRGLFGAPDFDQAGQFVGARVSGLTLESSRIDGSLDSDAGLAYLEWTLEFKNQFFRPHEARARVALPPGAVVSRVTLWVDGQEREAAFAGRSKVTEAYQKIVRKQRDPLLVTTSGSDRVMVQCFPVPGRGGTMKIRVGMTAPLALMDNDRAFLRLPHFVERNFRILEDKRHLLWIESKRPLKSDNDGLVQEQPSADLFALRGELTERDLFAAKSVIKAERSPLLTKAWCEDTVQGKGRVVIQTLEEKASAAPERVVLVVDGSRGMAEFIPEIVEAISAIPSGIQIAAVIASDEPAAITETRERIAEKLREFNYVGGRDNVPALARAWEIAAAKPHTAIMWIHRPQPVLMGTVERLKQWWDRRPHTVALYSVEVSSGPDRILEKLDGIPAVKSVPRIGSLKQDLERLFSSWKPDAKLRVYSRATAEELPGGLTETARKTSNHLARLWAYDEILRLSSAKDKKQREEALNIAALYQLVTPISGAVVLETAKQFQAEGLEPADPAKVPTIPEPETWALVIVAMLIVLWVAWRRRVQCKAF